jgi:hypothetical protein
MNFRGRGGHAVWTGPHGPVVEMDTFTCGHCQRIVFVKPKPAEPPGGLCHICFHLLCDSCVGLGKCIPFEKQLEEIERKDRIARTRGY